MRIIFFVAFGLFLWSSCSSQPEISVSFGIRTETLPDVPKLANCLKNLKNDFPATAPELTIELMCVADSADGLPKISRTSLIGLSRLGKEAQRYGFSLNILLHHSAYRPLFLENLPIRDTAAWFEAFQKDISAELLPRLRDLPVKRFGIGTYFEPLENRTDDWKKLFADLRKLIPGITLLYVAHADRADKLSFLRFGDEIGVFYPTSTLENDRIFTRKLNQKLSKTALKLNKPIFIAQANLIGERQPELLKNRMNFFDSDIRISGLVINNIFPMPAPCDANPYFGWNDTTLQEMKDILR